MRTRHVFYQRVDGDSVMLIIAAESADFPLKSHGYIVQAVFPFKQNERGWSDPEEGDRVNELEDKVIQKLEKLGMVYAGRVKIPGVVFSSFYSPEPGPASVSVSTSLLRKIEVELTSTPDPEWGYYKKFFVPTKLESYIGQCAQLHNQLRKNGDVFSIPREVDFACIMRKWDNVGPFLAEAATMGFVCPTPPEKSGSKGEYWCVFVRTTSIEPEVVCQLSLDLKEVAEKYGGEFDGWASPVMKA
ncbi:MAG: DUF695 domain-containing protein [Armatimonadetes bacterium]|nr:DUF695 domain-containing protein [Armatimonadota bacterium]MBX3107558.1 DUF695 domain-containing protein [Fimbriimonadaceae bacterium]